MPALCSWRSLPWLWGSTGRARREIPLQASPMQCRGAWGGWRSALGQLFQGTRPASTLSWPQRAGRRASRGLKADLQWPHSAYGRMSTRGARYMYLLTTGPGVAHTNSWGNQVPYQGPLGATQGGSDGQNRETGHNVLGRVFIDEGTALSEDPQRPAGQQAHRARRSACSRSASVCKAIGGVRTGRCASALPTSS